MVGYTLHKSVAIYPFNSSNVTRWTHTCLFRLCSILGTGFPSESFSSARIHFVFSSPTFSFFFVVWVPNGQAMKSNKGAVITDTYELIYTELTEAGITPILQYLDNETSKESFAATKRKKYQLAASHNHQLNSAKRAVGTFKNHFIAILVGVTNNLQNIYDVNLFNKQS